MDDLFKRVTESLSWGQQVCFVLVFFVRCVHFQTAASVREQESASAGETVFAQKSSSSPALDLLPFDFSSVLPPPNAKLLIVGVFHFQDPGADSFKPEYNINIFAPRRQEEVREVVERLGVFKPTTVAVEQSIDVAPHLGERYRQFVNGNHHLSVNEVEQLGFRIAAQAELKELHPVDAPGRGYQPAPDPEASGKTWQQEHRYRADLDTKFMEFYQQEDRLKTTMSILEFLRYLNQPARLQLALGHYLIGDTGITNGRDYPGADALSKWYNRNLRIFGNLVALIDGSDQRILLLIGVGHVPILQHLAQSSPLFEFVDVMEVLSSS